MANMNAKVISDKTTAQESINSLAREKRYVFDVVDLLKKHTLREFLVEARNNEPFPIRFQSKDTMIFPLSLCIMLMI